ncbi:beta-sandwich domain of Sec23/24 [Myriangium duriaei CBS 260.36]|uniref:Beta-sandwich domain of Sec23/24 n=1 Tax=Myriangium duriaei CBS 260.36 TaxID=1168546 RepID=A0A9P4IZ70_9PEZI|nr:beta-sandwich domain of Sec23/24 [Myriangium duriaei CBS 260.36]
MGDFSIASPYSSLTNTPRDENAPRKKAPVFRHPVAPSPGGYLQTGSSYSQNPPNLHSAPASAGIQNNGDPGSYFPHQPTPPGADMQHQQQHPYQRPAQAGSGQLSAQMGQMNLDGGSAGLAPGARKKKNRHAYHEIEQPAPAFAPPNGGPGAPSPYGNIAGPGAGAPYTSQKLPSPGGQYGPGGQFAPPASQFQQQMAPAPVQPGMTPGASIVGAPTSASQGRVDPEQIPSIPRSRDYPAKYYLENIYPTMEQHLPPPAAVPFVAFDQGNCSPKYARLTMNNIPASQDALTSTGLPLGLILQPLAPLQEGEQPIPVIDFGNEGPPRCRRCRAYINPFMTFRSGGSKFVCNMCTHPNDVTSSYFAPTDPSGIRVDRAERQELMLGTVEFTVPREYWSKEPVPIRWLFLIDVSAEASSRGFLEGICEGILNALYPEDTKDGEAPTNSPRLPPGARVGIVTFDREVQFYNLSPRLEQAQMIIMPDVADPFVPISEGLFVEPEPSKGLITNLLRQIPQMFAKVPRPDPALLPTLEAALAALTPTGGKIVCSVSAIPLSGPGRLFQREMKQTADVELEKKMFTTEYPEWKKCATKMTEAGVGVDFFMAAPSGGYLDLGTIGHVSGTTGGEIFYYPNFHSPRDLLRLSKEIQHTLTRDTGYQALMKVRCSNGLQISAYHGNFVQHTFGADLEIGVIDQDKALGVTFTYDGKLDPKLDAHFQSALLYTTASGERRVRCSNFVASVSEGAVEAMKLVDQDAVIGIMAKEASSRVVERPLKDIRAALTERTIDILAGYRKNFSGSHPPGQLVLPENLKELSMYVLGLVKSRAFKGGNEPSDRRVHDVRMLRSMGPAELSLYLYPRIIAIHNLDPADGFADENGRLRMPMALRASFGQIEEGGAYLVDDGQTCLLWLHAQVSPNLLEDLFGQGYANLQDLNPYMSALPVLETHLNAQVRNVLQYMEITRGSKGLTIQLARQGLDGAEFEFARLLYEDRNGEAQSYVDWLVHLHRNIQTELSGQRKKDDGAGGPGTDIAGSVSSTFQGLKTSYWG